jgi:hypothetical protein
VNGKDIDKLLRAEFWPAVRAHGFAVRGRSAWRHRDDAIDVVNVQSYDEHQATVMGLTTFSFQVNLGVWPTPVPQRFEVDRDDRGRPTPAEYHCEFRNHLRPSIDRPKRRTNLKPFALRPRRPTDVWDVLEDGSNAADCVADARRTFEVQALPWYDDLTTSEQMLEHALREVAPSPVGHYLVGFLAAHADRTELAREHLREALACDVFAEDGRVLRDALRKLDASGT